MHWPTKMLAPWAVMEVVLRREEGLGVRVVLSLVGIFILQPFLLPLHIHNCGHWVPQDFAEIGLRDLPQLGQRFIPKFNFQWT